MVFWAIVFFIISMVAGILGFSGIAGAAAFIAKILFVVFLTGFVLMLAFGTWIANRFFGRH